MAVHPDPGSAAGQNSDIAGQRLRRPKGRLRVLIGGLVATLMVGALIIGYIALFVLHGRGPFGQYTSSFQPPAGWHDITPPTGDPIASYAISPDVPGLIFACTGGRAGNLSISPLGPGSLWRTRDGGAHWERLEVYGLVAGCDMAMPLGGHGTIFIYNGSILVSHNDGDTWHAVYRAGELPGLDEGDYFLVLAHAVYRDGRLYAAGPIAAPHKAGYSATAFSVSSDDGHTWSNAEAASDPLAGRGFGTVAIAPDHRAPSAWFRLLGLVAFSVSPRTGAVLEHSTDGGQTWRVLGQIGPRGWFWANGGTTLATSPAQPDRICAGFSAHQDPGAASAPAATAASVAAPAARIAAIMQLAPHYGPPPPIPTDTVLAASDDGGLTWSNGMVARHQHDYGGIGLPGVSIDPHGNCFLVDNYERMTPPGVATIWRLAPGAGAQPTAIGQLTGQEVRTFAVSLDPRTRAPRLVALIHTYTATDFVPVVCSGSDDKCPAAPIQQPHLIWTSAL